VRDCSRDRNYVRSVDSDVDDRHHSEQQSDADDDRTTIDRDVRSLLP
jgi:hypothetical protein